MKRTAVTTEGVGNIASGAGPVSHGDPPIIGVGIAACNVLRDLVALEPPDRELRIVPEHCENTSASGVKRATGAALEVAHGTTGVVTT